MDFGLFFFSSMESSAVGSGYKLLFDSVTFGDQNGFKSVWVPERHFHNVGGLFPNPSVLAAALAVKTSSMEIRAGSVVLPLHDTIRVAEEWAVVDNISGGRVSISIASGWNANDFVFFPNDYVERHAKMYRQIEVLKRLWRGESITLRNGLDKDVAIRIFPQPIQKELPIWITAGGNEKTFIQAGTMGANVLTHLLGQDPSELKHKISLYRQALVKNGFDENVGKVALMLHTYVGANIDVVKEEVRAPLKNYLSSHMDLKNLGHTKSMNMGEISSEVIDEMLDLAFERYWNSAALIGTPESCKGMVSALKEMGVTEISCLVDFGLKYDTVMEGLRYLSDLKAQC